MMERVEEVVTELTVPASSIFGTWSGGHCRHCGGHCGGHCLVPSTLSGKVIYNNILVNNRLLTGY